MPLPDKDQVYLIRAAAAKFLPANHFFTIPGATLLPSEKMTQKPHSLGILTVLVSATISREFPDASRASVDRPKHRRRDHSDAPPGQRAMFQRFPSSGQA